jgi:hypothetical protein
MWLWWLLWGSNLRIPPNDKISRQWTEKETPIILRIFYRVFQKKKYIVFL